LDETPRCEIGCSTPRTGRDFRAHSNARKGTRRRPYDPQAGGELLRATSRPHTSACPRVGSSSVVRMRSRVDFPAPFAPTSAATSPGFTSKETPRKAGTVCVVSWRAPLPRSGRASRTRTRMGCNSTRHRLVAGGKYFSRFSTNCAGKRTASRYIVAGVTGQGLSACSGNATSANQKIAILKASVPDLAGCEKLTWGLGPPPARFPKPIQ
jgi:hypothetical protein